MIYYPLLDGGIWKRIVILEMEFGLSKINRNLGEEGKINFL